MIQRSRFLTAALVLSTAALFGCSPSTSGQDSGPTDSGSGCVGVCSDAGSHDAGASDAGTADSGFSDAGGTDAGVEDAGAGDSGVDGGITDAGNTQDAGSGDAGAADAGGGDSGVADSGLPACGDGGLFLTIGEVRQFLAGNCLGPANQGVIIQSAVVTTVWSDFIAHAKGIPNDAGTRAFFWVEDPQSTKDGLWVEKFTTDYAADGTSATDYLYSPTPGDSVSLNGYGMIRPLPPFSAFNAAGRDMVADQFLLNRGTGPLFITVKSSGPPPADNVAPAGFGDSNDGTVPANPEYGGSRVHIPGPLVVTDGAPVEMTLYGLNTFPPVAVGFDGFMVGSPGGGAPYQRVLVNDNRLFQTYALLPDGGIAPVPGRCDYGAWVRDGGSVTFPNGISGVWDTHAVQPCSAPVADGGVFCPNTSGEVPLNGGLFKDPGYVNVLWPSDCNDADGGMQ